MMLVKTIDYTMFIVIFHHVEHVLNPLLNQDTAKSFVKSLGSGSGSGSGSIVREDFYNAYREECCNKGCRLEEALEFCNTLN